MTKRFRRLPKGSLTYQQAHDRCSLLSTAAGLMLGVRERVNIAGAPQASRAVARAMKSIDGAIRHAQRLRNEAERKMEE